MSSKSSTSGDSEDLDFLPRITRDPWAHDTPLRYAVNHVFLPVELPFSNYYTVEKDLSLARTAYTAAQAYSAHVHRTSEQAQWCRIAKMLDNLHASAQSEHLDKDNIISQLHGLKTGDTLAFFLRPQNTAIILTKRENYTLYEPFEVSPSGDAVDNAAGSLICSYPRTAVETPNWVFDNADFQLEFASFLSRPGAVDSDLPSPTYQKWITALLTGIMRSVGRAVDIPCITKRVRGHLSLFKSRSFEAGLMDSLTVPRDVDSFEKNDWNRSSLWLLIRIAIQMSIDRSPLGRASYKRFMLFLICSLAGDAGNTQLSSDHLHLMEAKILRRLNKLGPSTPDWLSEMALKTCTSLQEILDDRWRKLTTRVSPFQNPSQDELIRDTQLSLSQSREYISNALADPGQKPAIPPFHPSHDPRGTLEDFLSSDESFFWEAYATDPHFTLYDVEQLVEQSIDDWVTRVTDVDEACVQLGILMDAYMMGAGRSRKLNPEDTSMTMLTAIELFVALDKLVVKEIPILVDYSPEIPIYFLEKLLLRKTTNFHRLSRAYQYLSARHSQSRRGWSVFSNPFTATSFPVRYYDRSPYLQQLKACIEQDAMVSVPASPQWEGATSADTHKLSISPLPASPLQAKAVVFELQSPACFRVWRSASPRFLFYFFKFLPEDYLDPENADNLLVLVPELKRYFVKCPGPLPYIQVHCIYIPAEPLRSRNPALYYALQHPSRYEQTELALSGWGPMMFRDESKFVHDEKSPFPMIFAGLKSYHDKKSAYHLEYQLGRHNSCLSCRDLEKYVVSTSHTPNDVLSTQADCPADLSLDEFIAFAHLRSGGSLQWINILQGLHSRTLNLRRHQVHFLLAQAVFHVGPLDLNTGTWIWHQELQDSSFCNILIDELYGIFADVGACSFDGLMMNTISLLLNRVLASSPAEDVSERAIELLRRVRRTTFRWVQELSYDLTKAPMNGERRDLLRNMAATCRATFDVDSTILHKLLQSTEDVDALLSCASFIEVLRPEFIHDEHPRLLLERDRRLSVLLEGILTDVILADPSDYGIDLAVGKLFASYRPGVHKWKPLQYPNNRWLTCKTEDQTSLTVHLNLLDGMLQVDGQALGILPDDFMKNPKWQQIFRSQGFFVIPSDLPGMEFTTLAMTSKYKVHFSPRVENLVIRAQCNQTGDILELIPASILQEDLPPTLIEDHVHWLNLSTKVLEIRPMSQLWEQSLENWRIDCSSERYHMHKGHETLVDIRSPTWNMVSKCFECLNCGVHKPILSYIRDTQHSDLFVTVCPIDSPHSEPAFRLCVTLPRYSLSFHVNEREELESLDFKDMVYDEDQCIGTLFGLQSLLVLRQKSHLAEELIFRRILVPSGSPVRHRDDPDGHVRVDFKFSITESDEPLYHAYDVDTEMGCLTGNGNLMSMSHLASLHSKTSHHRPDPLTRKTGAQASHGLLGSARNRSYMKLEGKSNDSRSGPMGYPQIDFTDVEAQEGSGDAHVHRHKDVKKERAAHRTAYLFPWSVPSLQDRDDLHCSTTEELDMELEDVISAAASTVYHWSGNAPTMATMLAWVEMWGGDEQMPDIVRRLIIRVHHILEGSEGTSLRFQLLFLLPITAYCSLSHQGRQDAFLSMLVTFYNHSHADLDDPTIGTECESSNGYRPTEQALWDRVSWSWQSKKQCLGRGSEKHSYQAVVKQLVKNWPSDNTPFMESLEDCCWKKGSLTANLQPYFSSCHRNFILKEYLVGILTEPIIPRPASPLPYISNELSPPRITLDHLFSTRSAPELPLRCTFLHNNLRGSNKTSSDDSDVPALDQLFSSLQTNRSFQQEYLARLDTSAQRVRKESQVSFREAGENMIEALKQHHVECRVKYMDALAIMQKSLGPTIDPHEQVLEKFGQWPPITADVVLRYLASTSPTNLPMEWKKCLVSLALLLSDLQRARRMLRFFLDGLEEELSNELQNEGCGGWNAEEHPDWLLIQIQGNFIIRRVQAETAMELISPRSGGNTVVQLNMGEGKSSVIIPIAAAALADGNQLVRVVVPKALTVQMFDLLVHRLGGLVNRPIYHLPFSRNSELEYGSRKKKTSEVDYLRKFMSHCKAERGVILVQPEHIISLKLMSVEQQMYQHKLAADPISRLHRFIYKHIVTPDTLRRLLPKDSFVGNIFRSMGQSSVPSESSKKDATPIGRHNEPSDNSDTSGNASKWLSLERWIHSHARDILDESDEILHTRFQLMYTIGAQQHMDGYPDRWTITQQVLGLVKERAHTLSRNYPDSVEYERGPPGSFPHIRIVRASDVGQYLTSLIVEGIMAGRLSNFDFRNISSELQDAIRSFISDEDVLQVPETSKKVEEYTKQFDQSYLWSGLLLLRGLLASNILSFALAERRWRVDYGLQVSEEPQYFGRPRNPRILAVPYRAKDMPAPNTQFGHPDITIILTCLSYYYAGLTEEQLRASFEILLDQDEPSAEYALWIAEYDCDDLPDSLQKLGEINLRSSEQWDKVIFPLFSRNKATVDLYLSRVVFPKAAKEFPWKLSGSSWDLAEKRQKPVTGFSGTHDGRWLLPMSITQRDLDHQLGTDARVLAYLLKPENNFYMVTHENGERQTTSEFLHIVAAQEPRICVLLDVGAQILDLSNRQVAQAWLVIAPDIAGAIYFNENDELMVLTQNGTTVPMLSSPLSQRLDRCVVYLDHAHTRGTDIKFPIGSRAAVTLGPKVIKDRLVQGCMRMRKLGHGHTVMFFAPLEVDQSIRAVVAKKDPGTRVTTADVSCWAIRETWTDIEQRAPHWAHQAMAHKLRYDALSRFSRDEITPEQLSDAWLQPECKSLADLYAPNENATSILSALDPGIRQRCKDLGVLSLPRAQMEEEQEREVNRETERERDVELPPKAKPEKHLLHPDVVAFVNTGIVPPSHTGSAFRPIFTALAKSSAASHEADVWSPSVLATEDFCRTIKPDSTLGTMDQYLRPVQWILSRTKGRDRLLVLPSPFEADALMPIIRQSGHVHLHVYAPRTSQRMKPSDDLRLYVIPPLPSDWSPPWALIDQLNVFAGQPYLRDYTTYLRLSLFLGIPTTEESQSDTAPKRNTYHIPGSFEEEEITFVDSPLPAVKALLAIRNRGLPFAHTHMGKIFQGKPLTKEDF